jgi:hypothetical protein
LANNDFNNKYYFSILAPVLSSTSPRPLLLAIKLDNRFGVLRLRFSLLVPSIAFGSFNISRYADVKFAYKRGFFLEIKSGLE